MVCMTHMVRITIAAKLVDPGPGQPAIAASVP
jgi:hypothetical protein